MAWVAAESGGAGWLRRDFGGGVEALLWPTRRFRTVGLRVYVQRPLDSQRAAAALLHQVRRQGCRRAPTERRIRELLQDAYGASLSLPVLKIGERQVLGVGVETLADRLAPAGRPVARVVGLVRNLLFFPRLEGGVPPRALVEMEKTNLCTMIRSRVDDRGHFARRRCTEEMCREEPFGRDEYGGESEVAALTPEDLARLHAELVRAAPISVYAWGDFDPERMARRLEEALVPAVGRRPLYPGPVVERPAPAEPKEVIETLGVEQAQVVIGMRTGSRWGRPDWLAVLVMHGILGMFPHSRLFVHVRERLGLAYAVGSELEGVKGLLWVRMATDPARWRDAVGEAFAQLESLRRGEIGAQELDHTKACLEDRILAWEDDPAAWAAALEVMRVGGAEWGPRELTAAIRGVAAQEVAQAALRTRADTVYVLTRP